MPPVTDEIEPVLATVTGFPAMLLSEKPLGYVPLNNTMLDGYETVRSPAAAASIPEGV